MVNPPKYNFGDILYTWHFDNQIWTSLGFRILKVKIKGIRYLSEDWILYDWEFIQCYPAVHKDVKESEIVLYNNYSSNQQSLFATREECIKDIGRYLERKMVRVEIQDWDLKLPNGK